MNRTKTVKNADLWINGDRKAEVFKTTTTYGNRHSLTARSTVWKIRFAAFGRNGWSTREEAHNFLRSQGFSPVNVALPNEAQLLAAIGPCGK